MFQEKYRNKIVLITGHTGFKGSWLSIWLSLLGAKVIGLSDKPLANGSNYQASKIDSFIEDYHIDIRDGTKVRELIEFCQPDFVFHLAAQALVRPSYEDPLETISVNAIGSVNVLDALRRLNKKVAVVMVTSDKAYDNVEWVWGYRETDKLGGKDPYSASKGMAELAIRSYVESFFNKPDSNVRIGIARAGNVIGGGDWAEDRLIPDIIRAFQNNEQVEIRNPNAVRPWQHVLEPLAGYMKLAELMTIDGAKYAEAWNFGPREGDVKSVQWIVERMSEKWGGDASWKINKDEHLYEANYLKLDCSKAYLKLNWTPKWDLNYSLIKINEWYRANQSQENLRKVTLEQIVEYMKLFNQGP